MSYPGRYLNPDKVKEVSSKINDDESGVDVYIYNNLIYDVCPSPKIQKDIHNQYKQGYFVTCQKYHVPTSL